MLPKKIPNYVLLLIWFAGTIPYLVVTFWLKDIPAAFNGADKLGELVAGFSSAFSTAFPFWYVIEWFTARKTRHEVATIQREFLDRSAKDFNSFVREQGTDYLIADRHKDPPNFLADKTHEEICEMLRDRLENHPRTLRALGKGSDFESYFNWSLAVALGNILNRTEMVDPHLASFSSEFKVQLLALKKTLNYFVGHLPEQQDYTSTWIAVESVHKYLREMETIYRRGHRLS